VPQAAWFFWSSPSSYLSFRDDLPANGLLAQVFSSRPSWHLLPIIGAAMAFQRLAARALLRRIVSEDSVRLMHDPTAWHSYEIRWEHEGVKFLVDDQVVFSTSVVPRQPLGVVVWIDNQFAAFEPNGRLGWGLDSDGDGGVLEISDLMVQGRTAAVSYIGGQ
jgi:hypothetical protein